MSNSLPALPLGLDTERALPEFTVSYAKTGGADNWQLTFLNGCTLSVLWGPAGSGVYSTKDTAELWATDAWGAPLWEDVSAYQNFHELISVIRAVASAPARNAPATREIMGG